MVKKYMWGLLILALFISFGTPAYAQYTGKKVLFVDSYSVGYAWSDGTYEGVEATFKGTGIELKRFEMDTKRKRTKEEGEQAALNAKAMIEQWMPDVVIASDDNAARYLIQPYYKDAAVPFIFCGINWDASIFGLPYKNVTGMIEVALVPQALSLIKVHAKGSRIGYIAADVETARKDGQYYKSIFKLELNEKYIKTMDEWEKAFTQMQEETDIIIVGNSAGIDDWNNDRAKAFHIASAKVPTTTLHEHMAPFALVGLTKIPQEQGKWAAETALEIIDGVSPESIPVAQNKDGALYINMPIASKLGVLFSTSLLKTATIIN
ncbi:MAG: ABC transporter substrate binding protein [Candidatus Omnitrophota bacterium]